MKLRGALVVRIFLAVLAFPVSSAACSYTCVDNLELRRNFVVRVTHDGKALEGVRIEVTSFGEEEDRVVFSGTTATDGTVRVANRTAGKYDLSAELLGISAGYECFHVGSPSSNTAKKRVNFT